MYLLSSQGIVLKINIGDRCFAWWTNSEAYWTYNNILSNALGRFNFFAVVNVNNPISPKEYQAKIRAGFSTNWFKSKSPQKKYSEQNIIDVHEKGFSNLRLRCRADLYSYNYSAVNFTWFLGNLTTVVDYCLKHDVIPIISWIHHQAEACTLRGLVDSGGKAVKRQELQTEF